MHFIYAFHMNILWISYYRTCNMPLIIPDIGIFQLRFIAKNACFTWYYIIKACIDGHFSKLITCSIEKIIKNSHSEAPHRTYVPYFEHIMLIIPYKCVKGSPDPSCFILKINVGKRRIRHTTTLKSNDESRSTPSWLQMTSFNFRVVLCRIRFFRRWFHINGLGLDNP